MVYFIIKQNNNTWGTLSQDVSLCLGKSKLQYKWNPINLVLMKQMHTLK